MMQLCPLDLGSASMSTAAHVFVSGCKVQGCLCQTCGICAVQIRKDAILDLGPSEKLS